MSDTPTSASESTSPERVTARYRISIVRLEPNPTYAAEAKEAKERAAYSNNWNPQMPAREVETKALETTLTDAEFQAVRRACIEVM